jgi:hypothetical protein
VHEKVNVIAAILLLASNKNSDLQKITFHTIALEQ